MLGMVAAALNHSNANRGAHQQCLVHGDCARSLRCFVVPKGDRFATFGTCVEPCLEDPQCPSGMQCQVTAKGDQQLVPVQPGLAPGERVCLSGDVH